MHVEEQHQPTSVTSCTLVGLSMLVAGDDSARSVCIELLLVSRRGMPLPAAAGSETTDVEELLLRRSQSIDDDMSTAIMSTGASLSRRISALVCLLRLRGLYLLLCFRLFYDSRLSCSSTQLTLKKIVVLFAPVTDEQVRAEQCA